jgi:ribosomal protein S18 acetylase RimI-like enzyme
VTLAAMKTTVMDQALSFRPMEPERDADRFIAYARDLFTVSFGSDERFVQEFGPDGAGYAAWIRDKLVADPGSALFACVGSAPVGMVVTGAWRIDPSVGYVHHCYLTDAWRGRGLGVHLDDRATRDLRSREFRQARLSVALANAPALRFYEKLGWVDAGPRDDTPGVRFLVKALV